MANLGQLGQWQLLSTVACKKDLYQSCGSQPTSFPWPRSAQPTTLAKVSPPTTLAKVSPPTIMAKVSPPTTLAKVSPPTTLAKVSPPTTLTEVNPPTILARSANLPFWPRSAHQPSWPRSVHQSSWEGQPTNHPGQALPSSPQLWYCQSCWMDSSVSGFWTP